MNRISTSAHEPVAIDHMFRWCLARSAPSLVRSMCASVVLRLRSTLFGAERLVYAAGSAMYSHALLHRITTTDRELSPSAGNRRVSDDWPIHTGA